jgi:hypothetical protein
MTWNASCDFQPPHFVSLRSCCFDSSICSYTGLVFKCGKFFSCLKISLVGFPLPFPGLLVFIIQVSDSQFCAYSSRSSLTTLFKLTPILVPSPPSVYSLLKVKVMAVSSLFIMMSTMPKQCINSTILNRRINSLTNNSSFQGANMYPGGVMIQLYCLIIRNWFQKPPWITNSMFKFLI